MAVSQAELGISVFFFYKTCYSIKQTTQQTCWSPGHVHRQAAIPAIETWNLAYSHPTLQHHVPAYYRVLDSMKMKQIKSSSE
jgi:hypothetical protein